MQLKINHMNLGELIIWLEEAIKKHGPETTWNGLTSPHSYRGSYDHLAFDTSPVTLSHSLDNAVNSIGTMFCGYKGGEFYMDKDSLVYNAEYSCTGIPINILVLENMLTSSINVTIPPPPPPITPEEKIKKYAAGLGYNIEYLELTPIKTKNNS